MRSRRIFSFGSACFDQSRLVDDTSGGSWSWILELARGFVISFGRSFLKDVLALTKLPVGSKKTVVTTSKQ
jgi:hypothetical protein